MAERAHIKDGKVICSTCSADLSPENSVCVQCGSELTGDLEAMICPYCKAVIKQFSTECPSCGLRFKAVKKPASPERSAEDEEFLKRLLDWGKKMNVVEEETDEDVVRREQAQSVFKAVVGTKEPTPLEKQTLQEIKKTAEERKEFERREESILAIAEPLETALKARHASLMVAEKELHAISDQITELSAKQDPSADQKKAELESRKQMIAVEKGEIEMLERRLVEMDETYKKLLADHKRELDEKEANLKQRLDALKLEMERREEEKKRLEKKETLLQAQEAEAAAKLERLRIRERELETREAELQRQVSDLKAQRDAIAMSQESGGGAQPLTANGRWLLDPAEVENVFKKSKKARDDWLEEQKRVQNTLAQIPVPPRTEEAVAVKDDIVESKKFQADKDEAVAKLNNTISELQEKISLLETEKAGLAAQQTAVEAIDEDLKKVLKVVDDLLGNLPDDIVEKFAKSEEFKLYTRIMDKYLG